MLLGKVVPKIFSKFTGEQPCRSAISIKVLCTYIDITLRHRCSSVNLLHIFGTRFPKNTSGRLLPYNYWGFCQVWGYFPVALDILKTFDRVLHSGLLQKRKSYGTSGQLFGLNSFFLTERWLLLVLDWKFLRKVQ